MEAGKTVFRKENPRQKANPISSLLFLDMLSMFWQTFNKGLNEDDLYDVLKEHKSGMLGDKLEEVWLIKNKTDPKYALHKALLKVFGKELVVTGAIRLFTEILLIVVLPCSIGKLVSYYEYDRSLVAGYDVCVHVGAIVIALFINALFSHSVMLWLMHTSMKIRVACCSLVYRKSLKLSARALGETTIGQVVNLLSNDVRKFDEGLVISHYIWIAPIEVAIATYLLYQTLGVAAFTGVGFLLLFVPLQLYLGQYNSLIRLKTALRTDERVRLMNEILSGIQVIKMYTWEKPFAKLVSVARRLEIKETRVHYYIESVLCALGMFITRTSIFISIIVYVYLGNGINADVVFSVTAIYSLLRNPVTVVFSFSMIGLAEMNVSIQRLQEFLNYEELSQKVVGLEEKQEVATVPRICFRNVSATWLQESPDYNLTDINLNIEGKNLIAVIGPVGSGKSTLLNTILKEVEVNSGTMELNGTISYASQEPWLFSASVKQNILFGNEYHEHRYLSVIKACALESDIRMLPYGDRTIISEKGKSLSGGQKARINLARCLYKIADIYLLDDPLSAVDTKIGKQLYNNCIKKFLRDKICILITHQLQYLKNTDRILILKGGKIVEEGKFDELQHSGLDFAKLLQQFRDDDQEPADIKTIKSVKTMEILLFQEETEFVEVKETASSGNISLNTYMSYFRAGGNGLVIFLLVVVTLAAHSAGRGGDYFVSYWVNLNQSEDEQPPNLNYIIITYSAIIGITILLGLTYPACFFVFFMRASVKIHDTVFNTISRATMRFFNDNPTGRILNRFSKDVGIIDEYMPFIFVDVVEIFLAFIGSIVLSSIVSPWILLASAVLVGLFYLIRMLYLQTARSAKRFEGLTRTPIFNHMAASMNGLSTIRAFGAEQILIDEFDNHQDLHSSTWYLFICSNRAFGFFLDMACVIFIASVIISLVIFNTDYGGGDIGLVVTQMISLGSLLQFGMRQWTEWENHMTSVERVLEYTKLETEPIREPIKDLPSDWPQSGEIVFQNLSMKYKPEEPHVLKKLSFKILPREKIGIVGRTGAGKTSIMTSLFQLYNVEGSIVIDGIDTTKMPLEVLRSKLSIIPQEPVLFSGTLRKNLDPFEEYSDETLWNALEQVELKDVIKDLPEGLNFAVCDCGTNFSIGQRQLVCLARALIRNNKILVMDEATANVDPHTDWLIQKTIRRSFENCTVLTIAHRLHTVMDSDKVLVMNRGEVVEFDHPHNLLQIKTGTFYSMVRTTGHSVSEKLKLIAEESYKVQMS